MGEISRNDEDRSGENMVIGKDGTIYRGPNAEADRHAAESGTPAPDAPAKTGLPDFGNAKAELSDYDGQGWGAQKEAAKPGLPDFGHVGPEEARWDEIAATQREADAAKVQEVEKVIDETPAESEAANTGNSKTKLPAKPEDGSVDVGGVLGTLTPQEQEDLSRPLPETRATKWERIKKADAEIKRLQKERKLYDRGKKKTAPETAALIAGIDKGITDKQKEKDQLTQEVKTQDEQDKKKKKKRTWLGWIAFPLTAITAFLALYTKKAPVDYTKIPAAPDAQFQKVDGATLEQHGYTAEKHTGWHGKLQAALEGLVFRGKMDGGKLSEHGSILYEWARHYGRTAGEIAPSSPTDFALLAESIGDSAKDLGLEKINMSLEGSASDEAKIGTPQPENQRLAMMRAIDGSQRLLTQFEGTGVEADRDGIIAKEAATAPQDMQRIVEIGHSLGLEGNSLDVLLAVSREYNKTDGQIGANATDQALLDSIFKGERYVLAHVQGSGGEKTDQGIHWWGFLPLAFLFLVIPAGGKKKKKDGEGETDKIGPLPPVPPIPLVKPEGVGPIPPVGPPIKTVEPIPTIKPEHLQKLKPVEITPLIRETTPKPEERLETIENDFLKFWHDAETKRRGLDYEALADELYDNFESFGSDRAMEEYMTARLLGAWMDHDKKARREEGGEDVDVTDIDRYPSDPEQVRWARNHARVMVEVVKIAKTAEGKVKDYDEILREMARGTQGPAKAEAAAETEDDQLTKDIRKAAPFDAMEQKRMAKLEIGNRDIYGAIAEQAYLGYDGVGAEQRLDWATRLVLDEWQKRYMTEREAGYYLKPNQIRFAKTHASVMLGAISRMKATPDTRYESEAYFNSLLG